MSTPRSKAGWPLHVAVMVLVTVATTGAALAVNGVAAAPTKGGTVPAAARGTKCTADRQLRGVWIATVRNIDWPSKKGLSPAKQRAEYIRILDNARKRHLNAVFVHVRPLADAFYRSPVDPWSEFLTGKQGKDPGWDPLPFLITQAHKRGMEFHAWFNPYRVSNGSKVGKLARGHPARKHPEWTVKHKGRLYYNPGLPEVRNQVTGVVADVVKRYDVDAVHFDDYFYPYGGTDFPDKAAFKRYGGGKSRSAWRRDNVNRLVAQVSKSVHGAKPYVKFGISPFGIWRNKRTDPSGSDTRGLQGYDDIFADARAWIRNGWIDYVVPQLYWPIGKSNADYKKLAAWWAKEVKGTQTQLYIGQALYQVGSSGPWKKAGELPAHLKVNDEYPQIRGDVYFSAKHLAFNKLRVLDRLVKQHYTRPALQPLIKRRGGTAPPPPEGLTREDGRLWWEAAEGAAYYAVYRGRSCDLVDVVTGTSFNAAKDDTYAVSALDRLHNESAAVPLS